MSRDRASGTAYVPAQMWNALPGDAKREIAHERYLVVEALDGPLAPGQAPTLLRVVLVPSLATGPAAS